MYSLDDPRSRIATRPEAGPVAGAIGFCPSALIGAVEH